MKYCGGEENVQLFAYYIEIIQFFELVGFE